MNMFKEKITFLQKRIFLFLFCLGPLGAMSQDFLILKGGKNLPCKILREDSVKVFYETKLNGVKINASINRMEVEKIIFNTSNNNQNNLTEPEFGLSIGFLNGGGSLVGADLEVFFPNSIGIQAGIGVFGYGAGLNVHLNKSIRSSFLSLQYWHQGIGDSFTQSLIGPAFVYRGKKWFTSQLGIGFVQSRGVAYPAKNNLSPIMLTYSLGGFFHL